MKQAEMNLGSSKRKWLRGLFVLAICAVYIGAESSLRALVYGKPQATSLQELLPVAEKLPVFLQEPIKNWIKAADIETKLEQAQGAERRKLLYDLAMLRSGGARRSIYRQIIRDYPHDHEAALAWETLIREDQVSNPVSSYLAFVKGLEGANAAQTHQAWMTGWAGMVGHSEKARQEYLLAMVEANIANAYLVEAYEHLKRRAIIENDTVLMRKVDTLLERSLQLWRAEQARMMEGG